MRKKEDNNETILTHSPNVYHIDKKKSKNMEAHILDKPLQNAKKVEQFNLEDGNTNPSTDIHHLIQKLKS